MFLCHSTSTDIITSAKLSALCYDEFPLFLNLYISLSEYGQLGQGHTEKIGNGPGEMGNNLSVIDWGSGFDVEDIACGTYHTCALSTNGSVRCCGWGMFPSVHTL